MAKYYVVKQGRIPGIYNSWIECKKQVEGFSNAEYKSFTSIEEAKRYFNNKNVIDYKDEVIQHNTNFELKILKAYVDGSFSKENKLYSFGCVLIDDDNRIVRLSDIGNDGDLAELWNVAGELTGAMKAIEWASNNNFNRIIIYHDYEGIAKWANKDWKARKKGTMEYIEFIKKYKEIIEIQFVKVAAHTGDFFNEEADQLAREAMQKYLNSQQNINNSTEIIIENKQEELFQLIMLENEDTKNKTVFSVKGYEMTEGKLKKFGKALWKEQGNKVSEIREINVHVDIDKLVIKIKITVKMREEKPAEECFEFKIKGRV